uniref:KEOPS complex subunit n=1 Tax=Caldiarchaeum subterraneum TaxID=311458 RepID=A0A7C5LD94_CALS0
MPAPPANSVIKIFFEDAETAQTVYRSIKPDDKPLPKGLLVETSVEGSTITVSVDCSRGLASLLATVDDILRMAALSEKVYKTMKTTNI